MDTLNIHAAKTHFSGLVERVEKGETIIIARAGKPVARLQPLTDADWTALSKSHGVQDGGAKPSFQHDVVVASVPPPSRPRRRLGFLKGQMSIPDDFNEMGREEIERLFNGEE